MDDKEDWPDLRSDRNPDDEPEIINGLFSDDGTPINPALVPKPSLCVTCKRDGLNEEEDILCTLNRADQQGEDEFICDAYEPKTI